MRLSRLVTGWVALIGVSLGCIACGGEDTNPDDGAAGTGSMETSEGGVIPCDIANVVSEHCHKCHGPNPTGGAIRLVSHEDWHQASPLYDPSMKVFEVAKVRINNGEMPQGAKLPTLALSQLDAWLANGAPAGGAEDVDCVPTPPNAGNECEREGAYEPLVARDGETCYDFLTHGQSGVDDTSKFEVAPGESYHELYYEVPWGPDDVMTRFGADFDNEDVLHHYLVFSNNNPQKVPGQVDVNVTGTTLFSESTLIGGWAVGGCSQEAPAGVGGELPDANLLMVQWHMYNLTGSPQQDGSKVQICVKPRSEVEHVAGVTFLGTESLGGLLGIGGMPPGPNSFTSECTNNSGAPITVIGFTPHMHTIGTHMRTDLRRLDGSVENLFDQPFQFDYQVAYAQDPAVVVQPGETLITTCSFFNDTGGPVGFGQSTNQEMCYQYVTYYPAGALDKDQFSLIGATNICW